MVRCKRLLGARPGTDARRTSPSPHGVWAGRTRRRRGSRCPRVARVCVVLDALRLVCLLSWMLAVVGLLGHGDERRVLISPCLGVPARRWRLTPAVSRAD